MLIRKEMTLYPSKPVDLLPSNFLQSSAGYVIANFTTVDNDEVEICIYGTGISSENSIFQIA